jgi:hypothetical protein
MSTVDWVKNIVVLEMKPVTRARIAMDSLGVVLWEEPDQNMINQIDVASTLANRAPNTVQTVSIWEVNVHLIWSGEAAKKVTAELDPNTSLVVMAWKLFAWNSLGVLKSLKEVNPDLIPRVVCTTHGDDEYIQEENKHPIWARSTRKWGEKLRIAIQEVFSK